jgi:integrase
MPRPRKDGTAIAATERRKLIDIWARSKERPRARAYLVWDTRQPALALQIQPKGHIAWKFIYRFHGRPRWYTVGDARKIGVEDARKKVTSLAALVMNEVDPQAEKRAHRGTGTFGELRQRYLEEHAKKRNKSWKQADRLVRRFLAPKWDELSPSKITKADVKALFRSLSETPTQANQVLAAASAIFSWAIKEDVAGVAINPCALIERNETFERERVLSESEVATFWKAFDDIGEVKAAALRTILLCGQRPGEVAAMRREHIKDGWWELPGKPIAKLSWPGTKNGNSHRVWLSEPVRDMLDLDGEEGFVFPSVNGNSIGPLDDAMRDVCAALGFPEDDKVTPHDLRRTCGTTITGLGFTRDDMDRVLNHVEESVTDVYDRHKYAKEDRRIIEAVAAHLLALASGEPVPGNVVPLQKRA